MSQSVKTNFVLNLTYNISGVLFHLITFPYVSRILLAEGIGVIQFYQSIINYVTLCTSLGIPVYAVREIARVRDDSQMCSKVSVEILILHLCLTVIGYFAIFLLVLYVDRINANIALFLLLSLHLFLSAIGAYWFYQGIEDFKYIAIRALVVRVLSLILLFALVKDIDDLLIYAMIIVAAEAGNNIFNFLRLRKFVNIKEIRFSELHPFRHLIPALKIFVLNLVISIYVNLDTVMLGFMKDNATVGYYAASTRITKTILSIVQSLGGVLLPRFSNYAENGQYDTLQSLSNKSLGFIIAISLPLSIGVIFMASPLIHLFCGKDFEPAILTIQIMSPIIVFIAVSNIAGPQVLFSLGKEMLVIRATMFGALTNVTLNFLLIPSFSQFGAGFSTSVAEFVVMILMLVYVRKFVKMDCFALNYSNYYYGSFLLMAFLCILSLLIHDEYIYCFVGTVFAILLYFGFLFYRNDILLQPLVEILTKLKRR